MLSRGPFVWEFDRKPRWVSGQPERRDPWSKQGNVIYCGRKIKPDQHGLKPGRPARQTKAREEQAMGEDEKHAEILKSHPMHCLTFFIFSFRTMKVIKTSTKLSVKHLSIAFISKVVIKRSHSLKN